MLLLEQIADRKILEAIEKGEFADLPGAGKPLRLEDDSMVPEDLRVAYRILKNAGCLPPELELRKEIVTLRSLLRAAEDGEGKTAKIRELNYKLLKLSVMRGRTVSLADFPEYGERIAEKVSRRKSA